MTGAEIAVVLGGRVLIAALAWYFFAPRRAVDAQMEGGRQVVDITVKGGYSPSELTMQVPAGRPMRFEPTVTAVEPRRYLEWLGCLGLPGLFDGRHSFSLTPLSGGRTLIQQAETFSGLLVPFAPAMLARTRADFEAMNAALARRAVKHAP